MYFIDIAAVDLKFSRKRGLASGDEIVFFKLMWCVCIFTCQALAKEGEKWQEEERTSSGQKTEEDADNIPFEDNDEEKL